MKTTENDLPLDAKNAISVMKKGAILSVCGLFMMLPIAVVLGVFWSTIIGGLLFLIGILIIKHTSSKYHQQKAQKAQKASLEAKL
jgi:predicted membrane channel-forming protein YqfA (hemolysin III family)